MKYKQSLAQNKKFTLPMEGVTPFNGIYFNGMEFWFFERFAQ